MKPEINSAAASKINWMGLVLILSGIAASTGFIPPELEDQFNELMLMGGGGLVVVFRSFFTGPNAISISPGIAMTGRALGLILIIGAALWMIYASTQGG